MFKIIKNAIFIIKYDTGIIETAECSNFQELFKYLAEKHITGNTFTSVHIMHSDGNLSEVEIKSNKDFIHFVNDFKTQYELVLQEEILLEEDKYWKLSLLPIKKEDDNLLDEFYVGYSQNLSDLRRAARIWTSKRETPGLKIRILDAK